VKITREDKLTKKRVSSGSPYESSIGFSRAVRVGNWISVAGTAPIGSDGNSIAPDDVSAQARRCFEIIQGALEDAGASLADVVRTRIFLTRIADWKDVGRVHGEFFADVRPASTMVEVSRFIDPDWRVEIEADAIVDYSEGGDLQQFLP
jgi:enamine deaminase RidA (YjgF/YER057c/UK114 family)